MIKELFTLISVGFFGLVPTLTIQQPIATQNAAPTEKSASDSVAADLATPAKAKKPATSDVGELIEPKSGHAAEDPRGVSSRKETGYVSVQDENAAAERRFVSAPVQQDCRGRFPFCLDLSFF